MPNINDYGLPFTSQDGDRKYSALEWREYFSRLIHNGLIQNAANECQVKPQAAPNKTVYVDTGVVFINGAMRILEEPIALDVAENTSGNPRIDRVVARLNEASRTIEFAVKQGTPAGSPVAPTLTRTEGVYELGLADITLANGYSTITAAEIADQRWDVSLCGASSMTIGVIPPSGIEAETVTLSPETAGLYGVGNVDDALKRAFGITSYLAFCTNANANSLDAGFGKGNEAYVNNLGRQLAMYAWFKGDSAVTYPFTNLIGKSTFAECVSDPLSKDEMLYNRNIADLIFSSPFATGSVGNVPVTALPVGEKVKFKVGGSDTQWYIADTTYDGVSPPISVLIPVTSIGTQQFHTSNVNAYGTSSMLSYLNGDFYNSIESVVKSKLQTVSVEVGTGNYGDTTVLVSQKVHLPSINEVGLVQNYAPIEGTKLKLFDDASKRNIGASWWLRTPDFYGTTTVKYINNTGASAEGNASTVYAVRPIIFLPSSLTVSGTIDGDGCHILV